MSIQDEGFLSSDIDAWIKQHRSGNAEWFALADDLNRIAQTQIANLTVQSDDHQSLVVALCFIRGVSLFQGSIICAERGMITEARTLVRSCFETAFYLGAAHNRADISELLLQDDANRREKLAKKLLASQTFVDGPEDERLRTVLASFLREREGSELKGRQLAMRQVAEMAELGAVYDVYYSSLSNDSAHPSLTSLKRHFPANGSFRWGPRTDDVGVAVNYACTACIFLIQFAVDRIGSKGLEEHIDKSWTEYRRLIGSESAQSLFPAAREAPG